MDQRALPYLFDGLATHYGAVPKTYTNIWPSLPAWAKSRLPQLVPDTEIRCNAVRVIVGMGNEAKPALPRLIRVMEIDEDYLVRREAAGALGAIGYGDHGVRSALVEALKHDTNADVRVIAAFSLGELSEGDSEALDALMSAAEGRDPFARIAAYKALELHAPTVMDRVRKNLLAKHRP